MTIWDIQWTQIAEYRHGQSIDPLARLTQTKMRTLEKVRKLRVLTRLATKEISMRYSERSLWRDCLKV